MFYFKNLKYLFVLLACALFFVGVSCVCATDNVANVTDFDENIDFDFSNDVCMVKEDDGHVNGLEMLKAKRDSYNDIVKGDNNNFKMDSDTSNVTEGGNVYDLANDLKRLSPGETYYLDKDYIFNQDVFDKYGYGILIYNDNITIDGRGHTIDGKSTAPFFQITGDNVKIINLKLINGKRSTERGSLLDVTSIDWKGDNGFISNCVLARNFALVGGAIKWSGNNGRIEKTKFINNTAVGIGGAIYVAGSNNTISGCIFENNIAQMIGETVYIDCDAKNCTIESEFDSEIPIVDGSDTGIEISKYVSVYSKVIVGDLKVDLIPLLYKSLTLGGINTIGDMEYYGKYVNKTNFVFTFTKNFENNVYFEKNFYFTDIDDVNDIFKIRMANKIKSDQSLTKTVVVYNDVEYDAICTVNSTSPATLFNTPALITIMMTQNTTLNIIPEFSKKSSDNRATFNDLKNDINGLHPGDVYTLNKDYYFDASDLRNSYGYGIIISTDNITINGNGHVMDGMNRSCMFKIYSNNVKIYNLTFVNSNYVDGFYYSPIIWQGNGGVISDCLFYKTSALAGGAIRWTGNNGTIEDVIFVNTTAGAVGGALYIGGENNSVLSSNCINSYSKLTGEAFFIDCNRKNIFIDASFDNACPVVDGKKINIDVLKYVNSGIKTVLYDQIVNFFSILYKAIVVGDVINFDETTTYAGHIINETHFVLSFTKTFDKNVVYEKNYYFKNFTDWNDVFKMAIDATFVYEHILTKNVFIKNIADYESARLNYCNDAYYADIESYDATASCFDYAPLMKILNFDLVRNVYDSEKTWSGSTKFDVINFEGNSATIRGGATLRDEYKWLTIKQNAVVSMHNIQISGFNIAIENFGGYCFLNDVWITNNKMKYIIDRDWGAGILNTGVVECFNCLFKDNRASTGGAIFNQGNVELYNCTFKDNSAGTAKNICNADNGSILIDGRNITANDNLVSQEKSLSLSDITLISVVAVGLSFLAGAVAGFVTANPVAGLAIGALVGASLGIAATSIVVSNSYDINFNRLKIALILIIGCTVAGGLGGVCGGYMAQPIASASNVAGVAGTNTINVPGGQISVNTVVGQGGRVQHVANLASGSNDVSTGCLSVLKKLLL